FFFPATATPLIYTLSLHDALPILGFQLHTRSLVQVSMNLVNYEVTGMAQAYAAVRREADNSGVEIASTEIVGLVPRNALDRSARSEEHTSELQSRSDLVCRLLLEK